MSIPASLFAIVSSPQWGFVYHLLVLLAIEAALGVAYGHWRRSRQPEARRLVVAQIGLLALRLAPLVFSLASKGTPGATTPFPTLERALDALSVLIIAWAFVGLVGPLGKANRAFLGANLAVILVGYAVLMHPAALRLAAPPAWIYAEGSRRLIWIAWQLILGLAALFMLVRRNRPPHPAGSLLITAFLLVVGGQILEAAAPVTASDAPVWGRLANLFVYPLLAIVAYKVAIREAGAGLHEPVAAGPDMAELMLRLFEGAPAPDAPGGEGEGDGIFRLSPADGQGRLAQDIVVPLARALDADQAAIGLLEGEQDDRMRLVAIYNPQGQDLGEGDSSFLLEEQLAIRRSLRKGETVLVGDADDFVQIRYLYALMGSKDTGPLLIQPLAYRGRTIGALIAGNAQGQQTFSFAATRLAPILADIAAQYLCAPTMIDRLNEQIREKESILKTREDDWGNRLEILDEELQQERESARLFAGRLADLEREGKRKDEEIERLNRRLLLQEAELDNSQQEAAALSKKLEGLARLKVGLEDEILGYRGQIRDLEELLGDAGERGPASAHHDA